MIKQLLYRIGCTERIVYDDIAYYGLEARKLRKIEAIKQVLVGIETQTFDGLLETAISRTATPTVKISEGVILQLGELEPSDWVIGTAVKVQGLDHSLHQLSSKVLCFVEGVVVQNNHDQGDLMIATVNGELHTFLHTEVAAELANSKRLVKYLEQENENVMVSSYLVKLLRKFPSTDSIDSFLSKFFKVLQFSRKDVDHMLHAYQTMHPNDNHGILNFAVIGKLTLFSFRLNTLITRTISVDEKKLVLWCDKAALFDFSFEGNASFEDNAIHLEGNDIRYNLNQQIKGNDCGSAGSRNQVLCLLRRVNLIFRQASDGVSGSCGGCGVSGSIGPSGMLSIFKATDLEGRRIVDMGAGEGRVLMAAAVFGASNACGWELGENNGNFKIFTAALKKFKDDVVLRDCKKPLFELNGTLMAGDIEKVAYIELFNFTFLT
jgi:hypothetical protein